MAKRRKHKKSRKHKSKKNPILQLFAKNPIDTSNPIHLGLIAAAAYLGWRWYQGQGLNPFAPTLNLSTSISDAAVSDQIASRFNQVAV